MSLACETIAGIKDRDFGAGGANDGADNGGDNDGPMSTADQAERCEAYCSVIMETCEGQYRSQEVCQGFCEALPAENTADSTNSLACREEQLTEARVRQEPTCDAAGPTGDRVCGDNPCDVYCEVAETVCGAERQKEPANDGFEGPLADVPEEEQATARLRQCKEQCDVLPPAQRTYNVLFFDKGDTLECRFVQVAEAASDITQCFTTTIYPYYSKPGDASAENPCQRPADSEEPKCDDYCRVAAFGCNADGEGESHLLYEDEGQCNVVCDAAFGMVEGSLGTFEDNGGQNTIGCRLRHGHNVLALGTGHCDHAGPGGANVCHEKNGDCDGYCQLMASGCPDAHADADACIAACREAGCANCRGDDCPENCGTEDPIVVKNFSITTAEERGGLACMLYFATRAVVAREGEVANVEQLCTAATGGGRCAQ